MANRAIFIILIWLFQTAFYSETLAASCMDVSANIESAGTYCLSTDLSASNGIEINSDDVVLDLQGRCLIQQGDAHNTAVGIHVAAGRKRITIRGGCVSGFMYGIKSEAESSDITIVGMLLTHSTFRGALLESDRVLFTRNVIDGVGGTTALEDAAAMGLDLRGDNCRVALNWILEVYPTGSGDSVGIAQSDSGKSNCVISDNFVRNSLLSPWGRTYAINVASAATVERNTVVRQTYSFAFTQKLRTTDNTRDNISLEEACAPDALACPDDLDAALANIDWSGRYSLFRVARAYHRLRDYPRAAIYYLVAAKLGSHESERVVLRHLAAGYITQQQKSDADRISDELLQGKR